MFCTILMTIDKPRERTAAALGVSLRTVGRVYLESQATGLHIYHTVNKYECDQCCECNTSQMLSCVLLGYRVFINE